MSAELAAIRLAEVLRVARKRGASDIHLVPGCKPVFRIDGRLEEQAAAALARAEIERIAGDLLDETQNRRLRRSGDASVTYREGELGVFRIHAYRTVEGLAMAVRLLAPQIPSLESIGAPPVLRDFAVRTSGLVLLSGPTGSGKSTAMAALVDHINCNAAKHVVTVEDPIEYRHVSRRSVVSQRQVGQDVPAFAAALAGALRSDPDVIAIGEMRDTTTMHGVDCGTDGAPGSGDAAYHRRRADDRANRWHVYGASASPDPHAVGADAARRRLSAVGSAPERARTATRV